MMLAKDTILVCIAKGGNIKTRALFLVLLSGALLAITIAAIPTNSASARTCYYLNTTRRIPCPQQQTRSTPTDVPPTVIPTPVPTDTPPPTATPLAGPLFGGNLTGNTSQNSPNPPPEPHTSSIFSDGGLFGILIGLIVGVLIGLLIPAVLRFMLPPVPPI